MSVGNGRTVIVGGVMAALLLAVSGCERHEAAAPQSEGPTSEAETTPAASPFFFVGRWAASPELCGESAWVITARELRSPSGVNCRLGVPQGRGPVEVEATCAAEGPPKVWRLRFAYAQSAQALLVENGKFADIGLVRCPGDA